jgi:hypothetical protein
MLQELRIFLQMLVKTLKSGVTNSKQREANSSKQLAKVKEKKDAYLSRNIARPRPKAECQT